MVRGMIPGSDAGMIFEAKYWLLMQPNRNGRGAVKVQ